MAGGGERGVDRVDIDELGPERVGDERGRPPEAEAQPVGRVHEVELLHVVLDADEKKKRAKKRHVKREG